MEGSTEISQKVEICGFYKQGKCRFGSDCRNLHSGPISSMKSSNKKHGYERPPSTKPEQSKTSMKTALDVIKRIQWDEMLPAESFTIGYLDRFTGVVEDQFTKFSNWGNLVS